MYDSMMAAKPILFAVDAPGSPVEDYKCGITIRTGKTNEIAEAMEELYHMPEKEQREMGERGRKAVLEHFTYDVLAEEFERLFR